MSYTSETRLVVRYAETDMMGIVHHSRYYPWFEQARTDFVKKIGYSYSELEKMGFLLPLTETQCKYLYGLKYEDEVLIKCRLDKLTVARMEFVYEVYRLPDMTKMSEGRTKHGIVDKELRPINAKKTFPELWDKMAALV
jgi:acyl-CoA thioester hydrolase